MFKNYVKIALRNLKRDFSYTVINVFGLAAGLASCLLIFTFVNLETGYDRFHTKHDRIYRVVTDINQSGQTRELAWSSPPLAGALATEFPEVEETVRIFQQSGTVRRGGEQSVENIYFADSTFFRVFDFGLKSGDPATALSRPGTAVITQEQADRFFKGEEPLGKTLNFSGGMALEITGILRDIPVNTHFRPAFVANFRTLPQDRFQRWGGINLWTYIVLNERTTGSAFESKLPGFIASTLGENWSRLMTLHLQPLDGIYFGSDRLPEIGPTGDLGTVYIFSGIGLFILVIAAINFMNLATAQSLRRAREVGIRKVLGVTRPQLIRQFLGESILLALLSMVVALAMAQMLLPLFGSVTGYELSDRLLFKPDVLAALLAVTVLTGVCSGSYPAFVLSRFHPGEALGGDTGHGQPDLRSYLSKRVLRHGLVAVQFIISIVLLIGTGVITLQLDYFRNRPLGFNEDNVVVIRLNNEMRGSYDPFKQQLLSLTDITDAGASSQVPGVPFAPMEYAPEGRPDGFLLTNTLWTDADYLRVMEIPLLAGRTFSLERPSELTDGFIINEAALGHFGWQSAGEALGRGLRTGGENAISGRVIGVTKDFNYESLHNRVKPLVIRYREHQNFLSARLSAGRTGEAMDHIRERWEAAVPREPLVSWFQDEQLQNQYGAEDRLAELVNYFSGLAILIACMGLFGLASYSIRKRTKEIGIRKVLGASAARIALLLSGEYSLLLVVANLVAWPLGFLVLRRWLENFAYRIELSPWLFLLAGGTVSLVAVLTIGLQSLRAARMNPVEALKDE